MNQRQLNMIQSSQDGIRLARDELRGPGALEHMKRVLRDEFFSEGIRPMSLGRAAYVACFLIAWEDAGRPPISP